MLTEYLTCTIHTIPDSRGRPLEPQLEHSECEGCSDEDCQSPGSECRPYQPPEYHSLLRQPPPPPPHSNHSSSSLNHMSSFKPVRRGPQADERTMSPDHIPRLHERLPYRTHDPKRDTPGPGDTSTSALLNSSMDRGSPYPVNNEYPSPAPRGGHYDYEGQSSKGHYEPPPVYNPHLHYDPHYESPDHYEQLPQDRSQEGLSEHSQSSSSHASGRPKRRRRKRTSPRESGSVKEQATNTDYSSNGE